MRKILSTINAGRLFSGVTLATLALLPAWDSVLTLHPRFLGWSYWFSMVFGTVFLTGIFYALLAAVERGGKARAAGLLVLALATVIFSLDVVNYVRLNLGWFDPANALRGLGLHPEAIGLTLASIVLLLVLARPLKAYGVALGSLQLLSPLFLVLVLQLSLRLLETSEIGAVPAAVPKAERAVVWLIFDELDKEILASNLDKLPAFRRLQRMSLTAEKAYPPSFLTRDSVSSMLMGASVDARMDRQDVLYRTSDAGEWKRFSDSEHFFEQLKDAGLNFSVSGWALPYCSLVAAEVACNDETQFSTPGGPVSLSEWVFGRNWLVGRAWLYVFDKEAITPAAYLDAFYVAPLYPALRHIDRQWLKQQAHVLDSISSGTFDLVYGHMSCPHLPRYDWRSRGTDSEDLMSGYLYNLTECDTFLGKVFEELDRASHPDGYVLIATSDHWFRAPEAIRKGRIETPSSRQPVPLMVYSSKEAGALRPRPVLQPFNTLGLRQVVLTIATGRVSSYRAIHRLLSALDDHETRLSDTSGFIPAARTVGTAIDD